MGKFESVAHRCCLFEVAFEGELTTETIHLPLSCLQGGLRGERFLVADESHDPAATRLPPHALLLQPHTPHTPGLSIQP